MVKIICANWKMNKTKKEIPTFISLVENNLSNTKDKVVIFPSFPYLELASSLSSKVKVGAQNCSSKEFGAFTGEVSVRQVKEFADYVIIGHSERRNYQHETEKEISEKIKLALSAKLKVILCVGESLQERLSGKTKKIIKEKITKGLSLLSTVEAEKVIVAYEPIWSISTTKNRKDCTQKDAEEALVLIKKIIGNKNKVIFGGNVNPENTKDYIAYDGLLIGSASLSAQNFVSIINKMGER